MTDKWNGEQRPTAGLLRRHGFRYATGHLSAPRHSIHLRALRTPIAQLPDPSRRRPRRALSQFQIKIRRCLANHGPSTAREIATITGMRVTSARHAIYKMEASGLVHRVGSRKANGGMTFIYGLEKLSE